MHTNKLNNREIEMRLQYAIKLDLYLTKQVALKTKRLDKNMILLDMVEKKTSEQLAIKNREMRAHEKLLQEFKEWSLSLDEREANLRTQIARSKKKIADLSNSEPKQESLTQNDRFTYTKNLLKLKILQHTTKVLFREMQSPNRSKLEGFIVKNGEASPFEKRTDIHSEAIDDTDVLWNKIKLNSDHIDEWAKIFAGSKVVEASESKQSTE